MEFYLKSVLAHSRVCRPVYQIAIFVLLTMSCKYTKKNSGIDQLTRDFYQAMTESNFNAINQLYFDSVRVTDGEYYNSFSLLEHRNWLTWDSIFSPSYEIIELTKGEESVDIIVSKTCKRTLFLNEEPTITRERLIFKNNKIYGLEIIEYVSFDNEKWNYKREKLVGWINQNHPELNGFIHDQTKQGGLNYLKAMELFQSEQ